MEELKPCPFCGSGDVRMLRYRTGYYRMFCGNEDCQIHPESAGMEMSKVIAAWNTRQTQGRGAK